MSHDLSGPFHQSSKRTGGAHVPKHIRDWPEEWLTVDFKTYPRLPYEELPQPDAPDMKLADAVASRTSGRDFSGKPLTPQTLSTLLAYSCGITDAEHEPALHRAQPSAGGRYPLEVYPILMRGGEIESGLYHYQVKSHGLEQLEARTFSPEDLDGIFTYPWAKNASAAIVITAVFDRTQAKYGERGYRYVLIEAGHVGQNIYLLAQSLGLKACSIVGTRDPVIEKLLDIDGVTESVVYTVLLG